MRNSDARWIEFNESTLYLEVHDEDVASYLIRLSISPQVLAAKTVELVSSAIAELTPRRSTNRAVVGLISVPDIFRWSVVHFRTILYSSLYRVLLLRSVALLDSNLIQRPRLAWCFQHDVIAPLQNQRKTVLWIFMNWSIWRRRKEYIYKIRCFSVYN